MKSENKEFNMEFKGNAGKPGKETISSTAICPECGKPMCPKCNRHNVIQLSRITEQIKNIRIFHS